MRISFIFSTLITLCVATQAKSIFSDHRSAIIMKKVEQWKLYSDGYTTESFERVARFILDNPNWPLPLVLRTCAEHSLRSSPPNSKLLIEFFKKYPPITHYGASVWCRHLIKNRSVNEATPIIGSMFISGVFNGMELQNYISEFGAYIRASHVRRRFELLIAQKTIESVSTLLQLKELLQSKMEPDQGLKLDSMWRNFKICLKLIQKKSIPHSKIHDPILAFEAVRYYLSLKTDSGDDSAVHLFTQFQRNQHEEYLPIYWWKLRNLLARRLFECHHYKKAYHIIKNHQLRSDYPDELAAYVEAEWLCGFLNLTFLKSPLTALDHFLPLIACVRSPISQSRILFWLGETYKMLGNPGKSLDCYKKGSHHFSTYYGQLCLDRLSALGHTMPLPFEFKKIPIPKVIRDRFNERELVLALSHMNNDESQFTKNAFASYLAETLTNFYEQVLLCELTTQKLSRHKTILFAKTMPSKQAILIPEAYPILSSKMMDFTAKRLQVPADLVIPMAYAIIRQECNFQADAKSNKGAIGLMQLMPRSAEHEIAHLRKKGITIKSGPLWGEEKNITLGMSHFHRVWREWHNSVLALCAYNAGPVTSKWIQIFGDPRNSKVDIIKWVELIPFAETRNYVMRVLENYLMYRVRLGIAPITSKKSYESILTFMRFSD